MTKDQIRYIKDIRLFFPLYGKNEKRYIQILKDIMEEYEIDHPDATYAALVKEFGTPAEMIARYYAEIDEKELFRKMNVRRLVRAAVAVVAALVISLGIVQYALWYHDYSTSGYSDTGHVDIYYGPYEEE